MTRAEHKTVRRRRAQRGSGELLHAEIVAAAKELLADAGNVDSVSVRAVADAVGVSPPSIYLHFTDKEALMEAVVADVFHSLDAAMIEAAEPEPTPMGKLRQFGLAYVRFAVGHAAQYRIATMGIVAKPGNEVDHVLATSAFSHFNDTVLECMRAGIFAEGEPLPITLDLWAAAHGIASLLIAKPYLPWGEIEQAADRVLCAAALGHAAAGLVVKDGLPTPELITAWLERMHREQ